MLSHVGSDVPDEWVFDFQGAGGPHGPLTTLLLTKFEIVAEKIRKIFEAFSEVQKPAWKQWTG
jgi:hypothetical protein